MREVEVQVPACGIARVATKARYFVLSEPQPQILRAYSLTRSVVVLCFHTQRSSSVRHGQPSRK